MGHMRTALFESGQQAALRERTERRDAGRRKFAPWDLCRLPLPREHICPNMEENSSGRVGSDETRSRQMPAPTTTKPLRERRFYAAPMVRYSKLPFRKLVRELGADCAFTPMIYASEFVSSAVCRSAEFATDDVDSPLIVQFAADDARTFAEAAAMVQPYADGVDLNCGCPKRDVRARGCGSQLLLAPEKIADIVRQTRALVSKPEFSVSIKIRVDATLRRTVELCRQAAAAGVDFLTIHGRTPSQRAEPPDYDAVALLKSSLSVPVIVNGDVRSRSQALDVLERTKCDGVMSASALLANPALFAGYDLTPAVCVERFLGIVADTSLKFELFHQHLVMMLRPVLTPAQRHVFNALSGVPAIYDFCNEVLGLTPRFEPVTL